MGTLFSKIVAAMLALAFTSVQADDIELFMRQSSTADNPNILIILDNTEANWSSVLADEIVAMKAVIDNLPTGDNGEAKFNVGLMLFGETGDGNGSPDGGYVRAAIRPMTSYNKYLYSQFIGSLSNAADKSGSPRMTLSLVDAYRYFASLDGYAGHNKLHRDHAGNTSGTIETNAVHALAGNAFADATTQTYTTPISSNCQNNFIIYISNGNTLDTSADSTLARDLLTAAGGNTSQKTGFGLAAKNYYADEWTSFMATAWLRSSGALTGNKIVKTYTVEVGPTTAGQGTDMTALLRSMSYYGLGKYFPVQSGNVASGLESALNTIISEVREINSVYTSASLPVSVNTQGTYLNQVFIGMFRPNEKPRWDGNLKQYQFRATVTDGEISLKLVDKNNNDAINTTGGFLSPCARSYWTPDTGDCYWYFNGDGTNQREGGSCLSAQYTACPSGTPNSSYWSNAPDGAMVERGAAGYRLRQLLPDNRMVKTCTGACEELADFSTSNSGITTGMLGVETTEDRDALINWTRGADNTPLPEKPGQTSSNMRPSVHGDVVHSRPLAIDYGGTTGVVVFYGANDGALHAINGNQTASLGSHDAGSELWAFVAPEHFSLLKRLRDNDQLVSSTIPKDYFFDGPFGAYKGDGHVWIYPTMRRGGRMIYAFDVTDPTTPSIKWKRGCPNQANNSGCNTGFIDIGQTWSEPTVVKAAGYTSAPALLMGGGYDTCEDAEPNTCSAPKGDKVYVLDADTGALLNTFDTTRSVVADITAVDTDGDRLPDVAYVVDTGGNIYRLNMGRSAPADWTLAKIATLGCDTPPCAASGALNRKFMHAPEVVVVHKDGSVDFIAILVGSGDREHPLDEDQAKNVRNAFFMIKDKPARDNWISSESTHCEEQPYICMSSLLRVLPNCISGDYCVSAAQARDSEKGWYLDFHDSGNPSAFNQHNTEQVVTSAVVVGGIAYFSTHLPYSGTPDASCGISTGTSRSYAVNFLNSIGVAWNNNARYSVFYSTGLPPSPVAGVVQVANPNGEGTLNVPFIIGGQTATGGSPLEARAPVLDVNGTRSRVWWYMEQ